MVLKSLAEKWTRPRHAVSAKVAIYSHDNSSALIMHYPKMGRNGLPGGHVELGENPDDTLVREVEEELGVTINAPIRRSFFRSGGQSGRLILAYTLVAPAGFKANPTQPDFEYDTWLSREEVQVVPNMSEEYRGFVLENWPN